MTFPYPGMPPQAGAPVPQPGYAPQWPSQQPQMPQAPVAPGYPQQGFPQQGYPQQVPPAAPPVQLAQGTLQDWMSQPSSGGGAALSFKQIAAHGMVVNRPLVDSDVQQQTAPKDKGGAPLFYRDGRPKLVLKVPVNVNPQASMVEEGKAVWFCQGNARDDLANAQRLVGAPAGPPEPGAFIYVAKTGMKQLPGGGTANVWDVRYTRPGPEAQALAAQFGIIYPDLTAAAEVAETAPVAQVPAAPAAPVAPAPVAQAPASPVMQAPAPPAAPPAAPVAQAPVAQAAPVAPPAAPAAPAPGVPTSAAHLPPEKQELLAKLTGQAPAA